MSMKRSKNAEVPLVSVVIVNYNRCEDLREALESIEKQDYPNREVIVVDNQSRDGSCDMIAEYYPNVRLIKNTRNMGMAGYSVACGAANGEIIFQMDNDSLMPSADVLSRVVHSFAESPDDTAILACRVEEFDPRIQPLEAMLRSIEMGPDQKTKGYHSGGVGFRKALMDRCGYYNEDVFLYGAELFLEIRSVAAGFSSRVAPSIMMLHKSSPVTRSTMGAYYEVRNRLWFIRSYGNFSQQLRYLPGMLLHDAIYSVHRRAFLKFLKAVRDGLGPLPPSIDLALNVAPDAVQDFVGSVGHSFSMGKLLTRTVLRLQGKGGVRRIGVACGVEGQGD
jgi:GT2 family glycosyltransferase